MKGLVHIEPVEARILEDVIIDLKQELTEAVTKGIEGLKPVDPDLLSKIMTRGKRSSTVN